MTLPTKEDIEFIRWVLTTVMEKARFSGEFGEDQFKDTPSGLDSRLNELLTLYDSGPGGGLPIHEVDIYLLGEVPGKIQRSQLHAFAVGDVYKMLPEDEDTQVPEWKIQDIRAHGSQVEEDVSVDNGPEAAEEAV